MDYFGIGTFALNIGVAGVLAYELWRYTWVRTRWLPWVFLLLNVIAVFMRIVVWVR